MADAIAADPALDDIDLIDRMSTALEQARSVTLAISQQLGNDALSRPLLEQIAGEIGVVHREITDAQGWLDYLATRCRRQ